MLRVGAGSILAWRIPSTGARSSSPVRAETDRDASAVPGLEVPPGLLGKRHQVGTDDLDGQRDLLASDRKSVGNPPAGQHVGLAADQPVDSDAGPAAVGK